MNPNPRIYKLLRGLSLALAALLAGSCTSLPKIQQVRYSFPKGAYLGDPGRPFQSLGWVRAKATYTSLDPDHDEQGLCSNYFNKAVSELMRHAREHGGEAVVDIKSVVFLADGRQETYHTAECSDDGQEGQILVEGIAVKWKTVSQVEPKSSPAVVPAPTATPQNP